MLSKISEMSGNRYQVAKQSHLEVCLSNKSGEIRINNPTPLRPTKGQNVAGIRRPTADDRLFMTRAGLSASLLPLAKKKPKILFPEMLEALGEPKSPTECTSF